MGANSGNIPNVKQVIPFLWVTDMARSLRFYLDGLGFQMKNKWVVDGRVRWCWLELGGAALMLQEYIKARIPQGKLGEGVSLNFQCEDALALYDEFRPREIAASEPQVGNGLWDMFVSDPDGYRLHFASPTDVPEETKLSEWKNAGAL
jgi:catechol 2,3-dioxygenase-like lactoylglutathione lyase family enzyme